MKQDALNRKNQQTLATAVNTIYTFYRDGFRGMILGKKLWKIILIKLFVMFVVLKLFFFPNYLNTHFQTDQEKGRYVLEQMTKSNFHLTGEKSND
ncbi:DUF4492 domain-containing protein [Desulfobacula sp.]|uniref:DUF4492 domain-containing protein n=1 Tax=Desulfobacula sp. TaxID=2593537 RepID=UPI00260D5619|nr:DUF4492 domain-containing protein [Desulfobacula sp.]